MSKLTYWERPESYAGYDPAGDIILATKHRGSSILDESNWQVLAQAFGGNAYSWRATHWACGWVEYLMLPAPAPANLKAMAERYADELADYPVLDEEGYTVAQVEAMQAYWEAADTPDRAEYIAEAVGTGEAAAHLLAALGDDIPEEVESMWFEEGCFS